MARFARMTLAAFIITAIMTTSASAYEETPDTARAWLKNEFPDDLIDWAPDELIMEIYDCCRQSEIPVTCYESKNRYAEGDITLSEALAKGDSYDMPDGGVTVKVGLTGLSAGREAEKVRTVDDPDFDLWTVTVVDGRDGYDGYTERATVFAIFRWDRYVGLKRSREGLGVTWYDRFVAAGNPVFKIYDGDGKLRKVQECFNTAGSSSAGVEFELNGSWDRPWGYMRFEICPRSGEMTLDEATRPLARGYYATQGSDGVEVLIAAAAMAAGAFGLALIMRKRAGRRA